MLPMLSLKRFCKSFFALLILIFGFCNPSYATSFMVGGVRVNKEVQNLRDLKRQHVVTQSLDYSCGAAGLSTLLNYYLKDPISEKEIIGTILNTVDIKKIKARKGFSLLDLKRFAEQKGYKVKGYQMDFDFLRELGKPVLVPIKFKNYRHFVIVRAVLNDRVFLADPAVGNVSVKEERFKQMWAERVGLVIEHNENPDAPSALNPLAVSIQDVRIIDYKNIKRTLDVPVLRTTIHTNEW